MKLYGEILKTPNLRFDYSSTYAEDTFSKRGLSRYGPYDSSLLEKDIIKCVIFYQHNLSHHKRILLNGLISGEEGFKGFESFFKVRLEFIEEIQFYTDREVDTLLNSIISKGPDIVYVLLDEQSRNLYPKIKLKLLANGIPNQVVLSERLAGTRGRQYILENIALASYAKIGGTPWTISTTHDENKLILGVSRAQDYSKRYLVGFVVLFTNDGDFLFMNSKAPVLGWEDYIEGLAELIKNAIIEYKNIKGSPDSIIVHFHKRPGVKEIEAIENALKDTAKDIPYAIVHINEYSNFRLFDTTHHTYTPPKGLKVDLSSSEVLLMLDGRLGEHRYKVGVPKVLNVRIDKRSTLGLEYFQDIIKQIYDFSHINWRGFNAAAIPITLNYSKLIARMVIETGVKNWNQIIAEGKLRDKAWFL